MRKAYENQLRLLIQCLPAIRKEECFAVKGGTAINLFYYDMPRLSVDIDLVYLPIEERVTTYKKIRLALDRISNHLKNLGMDVRTNNAKEVKLFCSDGMTEIKIEPNYTLRGYVFEPQLMEICEKAQSLFGYAKAQIVSDAELWGGKICAALDRQHPRDLFDIHNLFSEGGITPRIKKGFIALLLEGNRPLHEMLAPHFQMTEALFETEFMGMSDTVVTFEALEQTFFDLVKNINRSLSDEDRQLLLDFVQLKAELSTYPIPHLEQLPGIKWKKMNLEKLRANNPIKFKEQYEKLRAVL
ncbi:MAG: nucleotidyl transferase AbiEii/AbiGii toxin family protein [Kiritimatiellia bacterium]